MELHWEMSPISRRQLQPAACPDDLRKFWLGHASSDFSDQYALQLLEDMERRKASCGERGPGL